MSFLTVPEVAERLNVSASLVYQLIERGRIAVHRIGNGRGTIRVREDDIDAFLNSCRVEQTTGEPPPAAVPRSRFKNIRI